MKKQLGLLFLLALISTSALLAQRKITEATIRYAIAVQSASDSSYGNLLQGASHVCYLKGPNSRTDLETTLGKQSTIIQGKTGSVTLLKEYGSQHYLIQLSAPQWDTVSKLYEDSKLELLSDTTTILGYPCRKAMVSLKDGMSYAIWYTTTLLPAYREFQQMGKTLPGLLMEYESSFGGVKVRYRITEINFSPVPQAVFDIPTSGYRILSYEESKLLGAGQ